METLFQLFVMIFFHDRTKKPLTDNSGNVNQKSIFFTQNFLHEEVNVLCFVFTQCYA